MSRQSHVMLFASVALLAAAALTGCAAPAAGRPTPPAYPYNSVQRFEQMDRVAVQIVRGTNSTSESDYQGRVRPQLLKRLAVLGFSHEEIGQILTRVDQARADRQRVRQWWAGVTGTAPEAHARR